MPKKHIKTLYFVSGKDAVEAVQEAWSLKFGADIENVRPGPGEVELFGIPDEEKSFRVHIFEFVEKEK
ncbi:hypothetical protein LG208_13420 [Bacillus paralicheniformis]|uniref:hypothetical protein n=1 Tax=Bacillus paralicheniformis TaxID=1648923 RepID=UPI001CC44499|nr:hypothetical protein [Bacillus paralicheniformis]MBZ5212960.1 hypothetical protein [Bacillus paralicheniformis]MCY1630903.1 hypothetical protein [Bacillus paralicheniformis]